MSRIGRKPILIPEKATVSLSHQLLVVKGEKGELKLMLPRSLVLEQKEKILILKAKGNDRQTKSLHGCFRVLIYNLLQGVTQGFEKKLELHGVGNRARLEGKDLVLELGFSHPVKVNQKPGVEFKVIKNLITVSGIDKQLVGEIAAQIRDLYPPEPYKGKGIRYQNEQVRKKVGKAVGGEEGAAAGGGKGAA